MSREAEQRALAYIRESITLIEGWTARGVSEALAEELTRDAILWRLQTLADAAANKLSEGLRSRYPEIQWPLIAGFRNVAAHAYMDVRLSQVAAIIQEDLPALRAVVEQELARRD